mmetsp:Transcript_10863/g.47048  ORF Transcript_10863/g.47048 Transcript_10863/m.47048 type:complete len:268 (-) Transcript_10863:1681-2484(-)
MGILPAVPAALGLIVVVQLRADLLDELVPVVVEVACELVHPALVHYPDLALLVVQNLAADVGVVGDEDDAALKLVQGVAEGVDGLHVEVVGGLVHEENVGIAEMDSGEHHASLLASRELHNWRQVVVARETKLSKLGANLLRLVAPALRLEVTAKQVLHGVLIHRQHIDEVLGVAPDAQLVRPPAVSRGGLKVAREKVHQRGLTSAVGTDDAHPGAHVDAQVEVLQREALELGVLEVAVGEADERRGKLRRGGKVELDVVVVPLGGR